MASTLPINVCLNEFNVTDILIVTNIAKKPFLMIISKGYFWFYKKKALLVRNN